MVTTMSSCSMRSSIGDLGVVVHDLGAALFAVLLSYVVQLAHDEVHRALSLIRMARRPRDLGSQLAVLGRELLLLEAGEAGQAHLQDGLGLPLAQGGSPAALAAARISSSGRPARRTKASRPFSGSFMSAFACVVRIARAREWS